MGEIDWKRYVRLCEDASVSPIERFAQSLRQAAEVATNQSIPVYAGAMKGSLITVLRQMTDILKKLSMEQLSEEERENIRWKDVEGRMREVYFRRLSSTGNNQIAIEYVNTRLNNQPADYEGIYRWVYSLQSKEEELDGIIRDVYREAGAFAGEDVPDIMELAIAGIRIRR